MVISISYNENKEFVQRLIDKFENSSHNEKTKNVTWRNGSQELAKILLADTYENNGICSLTIERFHF